MHFEVLWRHLTPRWRGECVCEGVRGSGAACPFACTDTICRNIGTPVLTAEDPRLVSTPGGKPRKGGSVTVGAPIGVGTCPFEIWSRACSASCCILLSGAVRSATAQLPERFSHSLIKSSIALTIELAAAPAFATTALACLTASLRSRGLSPRASAGPFLYRCDG